MHAFWDSEGTTLIARFSATEVDRLVAEDEALQSQWYQLLLLSWVHAPTQEAGG